VLYSSHDPNVSIFSVLYYVPDGITDILVKKVIENGFDKCSNTKIFHCASHVKMLFRLMFEILWCNIHNGQR